MAMAQLLEFHRGTEEQYHNRHGRRGVAMRLLQASRVFLCGLLFALVLGASEPAYAASSVATGNSVQPFFDTVFVPCANGGVGEVVVLTGLLHINYIRVLTDSTSLTRGTLNLLGASGVGQTTGATYRAVWSNPDMLSFHAQDGVTSSFIKVYRIIGQGPGNNYTVQFSFHVTVVNGQLVSLADNFIVRCG